MASLAIGLLIVNKFHIAPYSTKRKGSHFVHGWLVHNEFPCTIHVRHGLVAFIAVARVYVCLCVARGGYVNNHNEITANRTVKVVRDISTATYIQSYFHSINGPGIIDRRERDLNCIEIMRKRNNDERLIRWMLGAG